jgi:hypothetical protein
MQGSGPPLFTELQRPSSHTKTYIPKLYFNSHKCATSQVIYQDIHPTVCTNHGLKTAVPHIVERVAGMNGVTI